MHVQTRINRGQSWGLASGQSSMLSNLSWKPNLFLEARIDVERLPTKRNLQVSYIYETQVVDCHLGTACYCLSTIQNCRRYKNKDATKLLEDKHAFLACGV